MKRSATNPHAQPDAARSRREFLSLLLHELRSPISAVQGTNYLLSRKLGSPIPAPVEELQRVLGLQTQALESLKELLDQVQVLLALEHSEGFELNKVISPPALVAQVAADLNRSMVPPRVALDDLAPAGLRVVGNGGLIETAIRNLISNALKFSAVESEVKVTSSVRGTDWIIAVADSGCGIPAAEQARVFEPFFRASNVGKVSGSGLGLLIVKQIAERHGGRVEFRSAPGGTTVELILPIGRVDLVG
jgi:signal transduction histidine kinase